ncbi:alpha/beta hydrolase [Nitrosomonas nitrosa]|uniref:alpha/beta hydrolase n=1 Tax=Nitrosomonas nitrosa TaxID=52442 RepID=UPI0023F99D6E|nr:alpha/beta hydrolase [Nitrosomonas nitrosa]MCO6432985.1 alpha/beta hydrolase [Nitrosomonas nitrosa]
MKKSASHKFFVKGPAGKLETIITAPTLEPRGIAIIAHPHPLHQGNMDNKVVFIVSKALIESGYITAKFNFRGVGASEGHHADGIGEVNDVLAVTQFVRQHYDKNNHLPLLLAGFSFGGAIQIVAAQQLHPRILVLIAPSVLRSQAPTVVDHADKILIVQGDLDDIVPLKSVLDWATPQEIPVVVIPGASHFFHGKLPQLKQTIINACQL